MANCPTGLTPFIPENALLTVAGTPRIGGQDFVTFLKSIDPDSIGSDTSAFLLSVLSGYGIGLLAPAIAVIVLFVIWTCALCFAKCTCAKWRFCKGDSVIGLIIFLALCTASCLGWFIAIGANLEAQSGVLGIIDSVDCAFAAANTALGSIDSIFDFANQTAGVVQQAADSCLGVANLLGQGNITFDVENLNLTLQINEFLKPLTDVIDPVKVFLDEIEETARPIFNAVRDGSSGYNSVFTVFIIVVIVLLAIFALTTTVGVIRVLGRHDILQRWTRLTNTALFFRKISATIIFIVGYIVLLVFIVLIALTSIFVVIGSDVCVPSPGDNILEVAESFLKGQLSPNTGICEDVNFRYACHYVRCDGPNPIKNLTDDLISTVNSTAFDVAQTVLNSALDSLGVIQSEFDNVTSDIASEGITCDGVLAQCNDPACETACGVSEPSPCPIFDNLCFLNQTVNDAFAQAAICIADANGVVNQGVQLPNLLQAVLNNALCENVTPLYQKLVEQEICNNLINGLALTYIALVLATFSLMGAMFLYRLMDLRPFDDDVLPVATPKKTAVAVPVDSKAHQL